MTDKDPLIGRQLANFMIEGVLGRGGMAQVYYGTDVKLQRPVAIKVIDARYRNKPSYAQRFVKEARSVAKWRHENIIQIYYADDADELYYYVMEHIDGQDLSSLMSQYTNNGGFMPTDEILRIGRAVASALDYAHKKGVIHRDVKPSNIMMSQDGRVVLGDFGLALDMQEGSSGEIFGTPHYISPEQARRSQDVVPQSDLYSLGVILYEMLTGVVPFDDASPTSVALQHITQPPPTPRSINPLINTETEEVILKALSKMPADRYQSGEALMDALEDALKLPTKPPAQKILPLPPIPAAILSKQAPTVFQTPSNTEMLEASAAAQVPAETLAAKPAPKGKKGGGFWLVVGLLALAVLLYGGFTFYNQPGAFASVLNGFPPVVSSPTVAHTKTPVSTTSTNAPSLTSAPSETATSLPLAVPLETTTITPTLTLTLAASPTAALTETEIVSSLGTATPAMSETAAASETPSASSPPPAGTMTATGTPTAIASPGPIPTVKYPNGKRFLLFYDARGLYLINVSDKKRPVEPFAFDRLDDSNQPLNHFDGLRWSQYYPTIYPSSCLKVEITKQAEYPARPAQCENRYLGGRFYDKNDALVFWTPREGSHFFRVTWYKEEVAICEIARGVCEVFVP
jgi:serine/threonine protein kinase